MKKRLVIATAIGFALLAVASLALARPGGGESYSGGGGHGGGGGGAIVELLFQLFRLCIYYPKVGVPLIVIVVVFLIYSQRAKAKNADWNSGPAATIEQSSNLTSVRQLDPDFSQVLFEDFAFRLFGTAQRARATQAQLATIAPYVSPAAQHELFNRAQGAPVASVVVGAMRTSRVDIPTANADGSRRVRISMQFEANVTAGPPGHEFTYYSVETWLFGRDASARTKPPGASHGFPCPNCGAPWQADNTGTQVCAFCRQAVDNGRFDWMVDEIMVSSIEQRPPTLTEEVPERGTDVATYHQPGFANALAELKADDPAVDEGALQQRLVFIFTQLNAGWSSNDLRPAHAVVSDSLFDYLQYWVNAYKAQHLRNALVDTRVTSMLFCKLVRDRWYDALTVRVWATGKDYVVREPGGELVRGSISKDRPYSEYWTLIRSSQRRGPAKAESTCSNCGAPLVIEMGGTCAHCKAHVTAGEFDWVLSKIEQDDSYRG